MKKRSKNKKLRKFKPLKTIKENKKVKKSLALRYDRKFKQLATGKIIKKYRPRSSNSGWRKNQKTSSFIVKPQSGPYQKLIKSREK